MFSRIRRRLTYTNVAMTLALVFAMSGGAYAASKYLITSTKQIKPSVLAQLKGKNGKNGTNGINGVNGAAGAQGPQGAKGETGGAGSPGAKGDTGAAGTIGPKGDTGGAGSPGAKGDTGAAGTIGPKGDTGAAGTIGPKGDPWTAGGVLPEGQSEEGTWVAGFEATAIEQWGFSAISFTIPLKTAPTPIFIGRQEGETEPHELSPFPAGCKGTVTNPSNVAHPQAVAGNLCVFARNVEHAEPIFGFLHFTDPQTGVAEAAGNAGTVVTFQSNAVGRSQEDGTWVVTAGP